MLMFTDISWACYVTLTGAATLLWYIAIAILQHYTEIKNFLNGKKKLQFADFFDSEEDYIPTHDTPENLTANGEFDAPASQDFEIIEELVERVKSLIAEAVENKTPKESFCGLLGKLLKDYPTLLTSQFLPSVNEFITGECEQQGLEGIIIDDVETLWEKH